MSVSRAGHGERKKQALEIIKGFEKANQLWGAKELADALECSVSQAWQLMQSLTFSGDLVRGTRTVVVPESLVST